MGLIIKEDIAVELPHKGADGTAEDVIWTSLNFYGQFDDVICSESFQNGASKTCWTEDY